MFDPSAAVLIRTFDFMLAVISLILNGHLHLWS